MPGLFRRFCPASPHLLSAAIILLAVPRASADEADDKINFDRHVAPILASHCLDCHSGRGPEGGLSLARKEQAAIGGDSGTVITAGKAGDSLLWQRVSNDEMPPKHSLSSTDKETLRRWIEEGAVWGTSPIDPFAYTTTTRAGRDWWSLQPLVEPQLPSGQDIRSSHPIDAFVQSRLSATGLHPASRATPRALVRRLYFDVVGLPPSFEQVTAFEAEPTAGAWEELIDKLLASEHYGERWGRHWLDVVRFGESDGFERNFPRKNAWPYRDWVVNALNNDLPYDEFVRMQLIGDQLIGGPDGAAATGFWVAGVHNTVVGGSRRMKLLARQDEIEEVLATVGQTFLGLTVNCARCHDHKFDPISQQDFYQLASAISGLGYGERVEQSLSDAARLAEVDAELKAVTDQLRRVDAEARKSILAARSDSANDAPAPPTPFARWEFDRDFNDSIGNLHGKPVGAAKIEDGALVLDGTSYVETGPLDIEVTEKTLESWVTLSTLQQRGGATMSIESRNGVVFDAIVFGEREPARWMAGSNGFVRTESFQGMEEATAVEEPVHIALVYRKDGTIIGYRNGVQYGSPIRKAALQTYHAGETEFVFGLRHKPQGGNRLLTGRIHAAAFHNRALNAEEIAAASGNPAAYISESQIVEMLDQPERKQRRELKAQIAALKKLRDQTETKANRRIYTLTAGTPASTHVLLRGDPDNVGDLVSPGGVQSVSGVNADFGLKPDAPEADRRRKLADWITSRTNPLFARVIVNRIWHYHFGTGLVDTPNDFGFNGGRVSHPELLEWLAVWFRDNNYSLKKLHRLILTSGTWQQAGYVAREGNAVHPSDIDAGNRLLWRMTPRRLEAEAIRDAMLVVTGKLNPAHGGPGYEDVEIVNNNGTTYYEPKVVEGPAYFRRTIYRFTPRGGRSALLDTFDCPDPAATAPRRQVTTTPLQALSLLNNSFVLQMSKALAQRIQAEAGNDDIQQVQTAWKLTIGRLPDKEEERLSLELMRVHGLVPLARGLFNTSEFVVIE